MDDATTNAVNRDTCQTLPTGNAPWATPPVRRSSWADRGPARLSFWSGASCTSSRSTRSLQCHFSFLSFGRRGTADLERRIRTALTVSVPQIDVSTFHSFAARVVERRAADLGLGRCHLRS